MKLLKLLTNLFGKPFELDSKNTYVYEEVEESCGKMTSEEVLEKIASLIAQENSYLGKEGTSVKPSKPVLLSNAETENFHWQVTIFIENLNGRLLNESEQIEYCWLIVNDITGEIGEKIYPR